LQNLNAFLTEIVSQGNPGEDVWESICLNLQSIGQHLFTTLIPPAIAEHAKKWKQGSYVIVSTNEQWIPWELMFDEQDFWGKKFIIARNPRLPDRRKLPDVNRPEIKIVKQIRKIVNVVGGNVLPPSLAQQAAQLFNAFPPSLVTLLQEKPLATLQEALPGTDALHCTCHGLLKPHLLQIAKESNLSVNIFPDTVEKLSLEPGILVFVNACASSAPVLTFGKFSSFGWEFYRRGARTFVGTLGAVPVKYAVSFAEAVYSELFRKDVKQTIGQAVALAKEAASKERNLFWLFYCIYGDPDFSVEAPDIKGGKDDANPSIRDRN